MPLFILNLYMQKTSHMHKKDGSSARPKGSMLEKAIRELEKMVAECKVSSYCNVCFYFDGILGVVPFMFLCLVNDNFRMIFLLAIVNPYVKYYSEAACCGKSRGR